MVQGTYNGIDYYVYPRIPGNEERQPVVHSIRGRDRARDRDMDRLGVGLGLGLGLGSGLYTSTLFSFPGMRFRKCVNCLSISWVFVIIIMCHLPNIYSQRGYVKIACIRVNLDFT